MIKGKTRGRYITIYVTETLVGGRWNIRRERESHAYNLKQNKDKEVLGLTLLLW